MMRYPLTGSAWGPEEEQALREVISSGQFTMGPRVREFEGRFAARLGRRYAVMTNSGSSANLIAVAALFFRRKNPLKRGDEVIVPCISWATTFHPLQQYGLRLKFVDVDLETLNIDVDGLKRAITPRTRVVVAVSILGNPCRFDAITSLCDEHGLLLFEDNCESLGARFNSRPTGTFGLVSTFSTFYSHQLSTMEGGLVLTDDYEVACLLRSLREHGWTRGQDEDSPIYEKGAEDFFEAYRFILPGYNVRPGEIHGAVGCRQLDKLEENLRMRRGNAEHFGECFRGDERFIIQRETGESSWFSFTMIVRPESGIARKRVLERLKAAGIEYRIITGGNMLRHDVMRYYDYEVAGSANADIAHDHGFFVGNFAEDLRDRIDHLQRTLSSI